MNITNTIIINMRKRFKNANEAYEAVLDEIIQEGVDFDNTKAIFNCGFYIDNPSQKHITNAERDWSLNTQQQNGLGIYLAILVLISLVELYGKIPPIWERMADSKVK